MYVKWKCAVWTMKYSHQEACSKTFLLSFTGVFGSSRVWQWQLRGIDAETKPPLLHEKRLLLNFPQQHWYGCGAVLQAWIPLLKKREAAPHENNSSVLTCHMTLRRSCWVPSWQPFWRGSAPASVNKNRLQMSFKCYSTICKKKKRKRFRIIAFNCSVVYLIIK